MRRTLADLEAELYAGTSDPPADAEPVAVLTLRRILRLVHAVMLDDEARHRRLQSEASKRAWANTGQPKRST